MIRELRVIVGTITKTVDDVGDVLREVDLRVLENGDLQKLYDELRENAVTLLTMAQRVKDEQLRLEHV